MAERERKQLTMGERIAQDKGVAMYDPKKKKWVVISDDDQNGEEVSPNAADIDSIEEL